MSSCITPPMLPDDQSSQIPADPRRPNPPAKLGPRRDVLFLLGLTGTVTALLFGALDPSGPTAKPSILVEARLDPNIAPAWQLDRIPGVGAAVARRIVEARGPSATRLAVARYLAPRDLLNIHGIGPAMVESLTPYLRFPDYQPPR